ncbi:hypothetical protein M378DRAFT_24762, partial [Amanita muscaria Koide BX008]
MSTNAGNDDNKIGVDHRAVGEPTDDGDPSIGSQTKLNQEHQKKEITAKTFTPSTATMTRNATQTKEELQLKTKETSTHSNTDLTQTNRNKSGGIPASKSVLKRFSTVMKGFNLPNRNRPQQGRDNDLNEQHEYIKIQGQDNSATDSQPRPEQGEKIPGSSGVFANHVLTFVPSIEQHRATDLPQYNEYL